MQFLKNVLSTIVGIFCFFLFFFILIIAIAAIASGSDDDAVVVEDNSVIELNIADVVNDYAGKFTNEKMSFLNSDPHDGLVDVLKAIDAAKTDDKIKGITLTNVQSNLGIAQAKALRDKLADFKKSGKFVLAYGDNYSQGQYYLSSVADTLYINPVGDFEFKGLSSEVMFFKDFQEKTGITMEVIRHGKYKSAVEPFIANEMSPENREQMSTLLNAVWTSVSNDISKSRKIPLDSLNGIAERLSARTPEMAKANGLIDKIAYFDEYEGSIKKALKVEKDEDYNSVDILDYVEATRIDELLKEKDDHIAIIYAQGEIANGEGSLTSISTESMRTAFQEAVEDDAVKAIVLRVDSPGGDALVSDLIWREVELAKKKKPVVVSMGNYAASGGYYISCGADRIFAEEGTITGSIGVFGVLPNLTKVTNNLGIHTEEVSTHGNAADYSLFRPLEDKTRAVIQESVEHVYGTFISRVAAGRKLSTEAVDAIGQGRVWSGTDAKRIGLVDEIGGLDAAIKYAATKAKLKEYSTVDFPEYEATFDRFFAKATGLPFTQTRESLIKEEIGTENYKILERIRRVMQERGTQAAMPFEITIR